MDYTPDDLKTELAAQEPGEETCVAYGLYALLFPPGEPDQGARNAAVAFATANGCTISNRKDDNFVCFRKAGQMKWATTGFRASLPRPVPSRKSPAEAGGKERHGTFEGHPVMRQRADAIVVPA
jgi:hypothetical protein